MRRVLLFGVLIAILLAVGWFFLLIRPIQADIADAQDQLETAQQQELILQTELNRLRRIKDAELQYTTAVSELNTAIPPTPELGSLIDQLEILAEASGVTWRNASYTNPGEESDAGFREIGVNISVEGQYFQILGYLYGIADLDRLVRVDGLNVASSLSADGFTVLTTTINATAFTTGPVVIPTPEELIDPAEDGGEDDDTSTTTTTEQDTTTTTEAEE